MDTEKIWATVGIYNDTHLKLEEFVSERLTAGATKDDIAAILSSVSLRLLANCKMEEDDFCGSEVIMDDHWIDASLTAIVFVLVELDKHIDLQPANLDEMVRATDKWLGKRIIY